MAPSHKDTHQILNNLRRGTTYRATTDDRTTVGQFVGMETPYGERAILIHNADGTDSIRLDDLISIRLEAA